MIIASPKESIIHPYTLQHNQRKQAFGVIDSSYECHSFNRVYLNIMRW